MTSSQFRRTPAARILRSSGWKRISRNESTMNQSTYNYSTMTPLTLLIGFHEAVAYAMSQTSHSYSRSLF
jgi:hypothetical protein